MSTIGLAMAPGDLTYDVHSPVSVFLGPSLSLERARRRLAASYYPPARMGDVYRLIATGVQVIVIIDGIFHAAPAVWHREILEALGQGIRVIGAASMGALRAAELHTLGMIGVGTVFEWYRDGVIDGDDEVALLHADAKDGYRALSLPLVDLRHRLRGAVAGGALSAECAGALCDHAKGLSFARRSVAELLASDPVRAWPPEAQARLRLVLDDPAPGLKALDAERALDYAAALRPAEAVPPACQELVPSRFHLGASVRQRGLLHPSGRLVSGEALWNTVREDAKLVRSCLARAATVFYLGRLADHHGLKCPRAYAEAFVARWDEQHGAGDLAAWLRANGLTAPERLTLLHRRALVSWMVERGPEALGLPPSRLPPRLLALLGGPDEGSPAEVRLRATELVLLRAWADINGIRCPQAVIEATEERLRGPGAALSAELGQDTWRALVAQLAQGRWLVDQQPYHFGYTGWSPIFAVLQELRLTGRAGRMVAERW